MNETQTKKTFVYYTNFAIQLVVFLLFMYWFFLPEDAPPGEAVAAMAPFFGIIGIFGFWVFGYVVVLAVAWIHFYSEDLDLRYRKWLASTGGGKQ